MPDTFWSLVCASHLTLLSTTCRSTDTTPAARCRRHDERVGLADANALRHVDAGDVRRGCCLEDGTLREDGAHDQNRRGRRPHEPRVGPGNRRGHRCGHRHRVRRQRTRRDELAARFIVAVFVAEAEPVRPRPHGPAGRIPREQMFFRKALGEARRETAWRLARVAVQQVLRHLLFQRFHERRDFRTAFGALIAQQAREPRRAGSGSAHRTGHTAHAARWATSLFIFRTLPGTLRSLSCQDAKARRILPAPCELLTSGAYIAYIAYIRGLRPAPTSGAYVRRLHPAPTSGFRRASPQTESAFRPSTRAAPPARPG